MYQPAEVLRYVSDHAVLVVLLGGITLLCNFVYFGEAARLGFRDRCAPMALWGTAIFLAHDGNYLLDYGKWFNTYDHWFPKLFWVALCVTFTFELVFFSQIVRFGRAEFAPALSQRMWTLYCVGAVAAGVIGWAIVKRVLDDDLYLVSFMVTILLCGPSSMPIMMRRGSRRGFSPLEFGAFTVMALGFAVTTQLFSASFHNLTWIVLSAAAVGYGLVMIRAVVALPPYRPAEVSAPAMSLLD